MTEPPVAIVLAGGRGARLRSRVSDVPKPMAPVGGRPFLELVLDRLARQGVEQVVLAIGYLGHHVADHFGDSWGGLHLQYSTETSPLGTGGAVRRALGFVAAPPILLLNGDTLAPLDLPALASAGTTSSTGLVMTVCDVPDTSRFGTVGVGRDGVARSIDEKGRAGAGTINAGVYWLGDRVVEHLRTMPEAFSFEEEVLTPWLSHHGAAVVRVEGSFLDIGVPEDYDRAELVARASRV